MTKPTCNTCGRELTLTGITGREGIAQRLYQCMNFGNCQDCRIYTEAGNTAAPARVAIKAPTSESLRKRAIAGLAALNGSIPQY